MIVVFLPRAAPPHEVDGGIVREANQKGAFIARATQQVGFAREPGENLLEKIACVRFVAGEVKQEREQRLGVFIIDSFKVGRCRHCFCINDAPDREVCLGFLNNR